MVTYNEIRYSMPVLEGAALDRVDVEIEVCLVEVASVVDSFTDVVDEETLVELVLDVSVPGTHWPRIFSGEFDYS
jgi:hypothetical protein